MSKSNLAPHCLGQACSFFPTTAPCKRCPSSIDCAKQVMGKLERINETLNVTPLLSATQTYLDKHGVATKAIHLESSHSVKFQVEVDLSALSIRARKIATAILTRGIDMKQDARRGGNRLKFVKPTYLFAIQGKLNQDGRFTHEELKALIRADRPDCKETAISNHASFAAQALMALNVISKTGSAYDLAN